MEHIHPLQPIGVIVLIAVLLYLRWKRSSQNPEKGSKAGEPRPAIGREKPAKPEEPPEVVYTKMRQRALETTPESLAQAGALEVGQPYGVVMEMGIPNSVVTLACFADGDASIYYKTGGGMVGGIAHESVRKIAREFVAQSAKALPKMAGTTSHPLPEPDRVRFYVLTARGTFTTETDRKALADPESELSSLFYSGQEVVAQMRQVQEERSKYL